MPTFYAEECRTTELWTEEDMAPREDFSLKWKIKHANEEERSDIAEFVRFK